MDRVRLGRVLGRGARLAARTAWEAMDAATAEDPVPSATRKPPVPEILPSKQRASEAPSFRKQTRSPQNRREQAAVQGASTASSARPRRPAGLFTPMKRASQAVSLEVTGSFFVLFAFSFSVALWRDRQALHQGAPGIYRYGIYVLGALSFTYFAVSNFRKARRLP